MNLHDLDTIRPTPLEPEIERRRTSAEPPRPIPDPNRLGRRITAGIVAFAVFGLALAVGSGIVTDRSTPVPTEDPWVGYGEGWSELPVPPEWRDGATVVWTGDELLYWGGAPRGEDASRQQADGFVFDPATRTWSTMPAAPHPSLNGAGVWTGTEALFFSYDTDGVRSQLFDPSTATWRSIPNGPQMPEFGVSWAWTGAELLLFGGGQLGDRSNVTTWSLDPATESWTHLSDAPIGMNLSDATWTGTEMVVVGSAMDRGNHATTRTAQAEAFDPTTDTWRELPAPPVSAQTAAAAFVGGRLIGWELYGPDSAEWLPDEDRWRSLDMGGFEGGECYASGVTVADAVFTWNCGSPTAWFASSSAWIHIDRPLEAESGFSYSFGWLSAAGDAAVVEEIETVAGPQGEPYVGSSDAPEHLWLWKPPAVAPESSWTPKRVDAENLVGNFLSDWYPGWEAFLAATATADVIDRSRLGRGGLVPLGDGAVGRNFGESTSLGQGTFSVAVELIKDHQVIGTEVFTVGPGTTADGRAGQLVITDVQPA
jgi:hypothetical protein